VARKLHLSLLRIQEVTHTTVSRETCMGGLEQLCVVRRATREELNSLQLNRAETQQS
jgi:hypothetical protein